MKAKIILIAAVLVIVALIGTMLTSCKPVAVEETEATEAQVTETKVEETKAEEKVTLGMVWITATNPYHVAWIKGAEDAAKAYGVDLITLNAEGSAEKQIAAVENLITQKVKVIMVDPVDAKAIVPAIEKAKAAGITFIAMNNNVEAADVSGVLNDYNDTYKLTQAMATYYGGKAEVCYLGGQPGNYAGEQRQAGFETAIKENYPDVKILSILPTDWDPAKAQKIMEDWLTSYEKIDAVAAASDTLTLPAMKTAENAGRTEMLWWSFDGMEEALELIKQGKIMADILLGPVREGWWFVQLGYRIAVLSEKLDKVIPLPTHLVMKDETAQKCFDNGLPKDTPYITPETAIEYARSGMSEFGPESLK